MVTTIIGGRLVDRIGVRAVMIPGLIILAFATWQLTQLTLYSPYSWMQSMLILRGMALGLTIQPLTVASLSEISPRQLGQASAISTVNRAVSSSLGIAILATLVQTQSLLHFGHLAEQVTSSSRLGQLIPFIQNYFVAHGADPTLARHTAIQLIARFVQGQAFVMAIQDALRLTLVFIVVAIIATFFVRSKPKPQSIPQQAPAADTHADTREAATAEAVLAG
jgi:DHA2 family multidrug resistance protein